MFRKDQEFEVWDCAPHNGVPSQVNQTLNWFTSTAPHNTLQRDQDLGTTQPQANSSPI